MDIASIQPAVIPISGASQVSRVSPDEAAERQRLITAVKAVNKSGILGDENELVFRVDPGRHRAIAQIVNRKTREVIEQLPPEDVLQLAAQSSRTA